MTSSRAARIEAIDQLPTPAAVVDLDRLETNIARMQATCDRLGVTLRPHLKTHKCVEIARLQVERGARGVTVSTLEESRAFASAGFDDLTWAFPVIPGRLDEVRELADAVQLRLVVDSEVAVEALAALGGDLELLLKVDCGYHRAGLDPTGDELLDLAARIETTPSLRLAGILSHSGHAYKGSGRAELAAIAEEERGVMATAADRLRQSGFALDTVSVGSTPAMSAVESLDGVTEARPGNYVFYDWTQVALGSATAADCALTLVSSVVSSRAAAGGGASGGRAVCDAGALALSVDPGPNHVGHATMGEIYGDYETGDLEPDLRLVSLSQEHGVLSRARPVGERLRILPNHSCLAAACFDAVWVCRGDEVVDRWTIHRERR